MAQEDLSGAMEWYRKQAAVAKTCGDRHLLNIAIGNLAAIFIKKDYGQALGYVKERLTLAEEIGDKRWMSISLSHLSHILKHKGDQEGALASSSRAVALAREMGIAKMEEAALELEREIARQEEAAIR